MVRLNFTRINALQMNFFSEFAAVVVMVLLDQKFRKLGKFAVGVEAKSSRTVNTICRQFRLAGALPSSSRVVFLHLSSQPHNMARCSPLQYLQCKCRCLSQLPATQSFKAGSSSEYHLSLLHKTKAAKFLSAFKQVSSIEPSPAAGVQFFEALASSNTVNVSVACLSTLRGQNNRRLNFVSKNRQYAGRFSSQSYRSFGMSNVSSSHKVNNALTPSVAPYVRDVSPIFFCCNQKFFQSQKLLSNAQRSRLARALTRQSCQLSLSPILHTCQLSPLHYSAFSVGNISNFRAVLRFQR